MEENWIDFESEQPKHTGIYITTCRIHEDVVDEHWVEMLRYQEVECVCFWEDLHTKQRKTVIAWMQKPKAYFKEVA